MSKTVTARKPAANRGKVSPFAAAMTVKGKKAEDEDEKKQGDDESDEDYAKRMKGCKDLSDDEKQAADEKDDAYAARMRGDAGEDDETTAESGDDEEKKAAARAEGITAERTRWETVLSSPAAEGKGAQACEMLAGTDLSGERIISALGKMTAPTAAAPVHGLSARMAANKTPAPSPTAAAALPAAGGALTSEMITSAAARARGEVK